jgi:flagellin-like hook-associated protein FlgL
VLASLNGSGTSASLQALAAAKVDLSVSQKRLSTGLKVADARDDGATAAIATHIKTQIVEQSVLRDNRMRMRSLLDVTQSSVENITDVLTQMKEKALALQDTSLDTTSRSALTNDLTALSHQIDQATGNSGFNGINLLTSTVTPNYYNFGAQVGTSVSGSVTLPASDVAGAFYLDVYSANTSQIQFQMDLGLGPANYISGLLPRYANYAWAFGTTASVTPTTVNYQVTATGGGTVDVYGASYWPDRETTYFPVEPGGGTLPVAHTPMSAASLGVDNLSSLSLNAVFGRVDQALKTVTTAAAYYGGKSNLVDNLIKQGDAQTATLQKGYGDLVDADMATEAATLQARRSREKLAEQSLAISNQAPKMLLRLFAH